MPALPLLDESFLRAQWDAEFRDFEAGPESAALLGRLRAWAVREALTEKASETAFIQRFFADIWGYRLQGQAGADGTYTCRPQFEVARAGQTGGTGYADLALGRFGTGADGVPQALCEFKDIRSGLEARQARKGNDRSPVDQAFDYLQGAWQARDRDALVEPAWAVVTDMKEFRLYARRLGKSQAQRFVLRGGGPADPGLLADHPSAPFRRFAFARLFRPDLLLADRGPSPLDRLLRDQITREKALEKSFYQDYRAYREFLFRALAEANPGFPGTRGKLVRLTQRFLDRCIFILFCEDMGRVLRYPPELLRDLLIEESQSKFYDPEGAGPWDAMRRLFQAMRDGTRFGTHEIDRFNGGLFEADPDLESLRIPAKVFCAAGQAADLLGHPKTLLYFSGAYNFGLAGEGAEKAISLYTLGRIFEQSITELEIMEAEADGRLSLNRLTRRKTDGVYYTPEWVTRYLVDQTVGARIDDLKAELGFAALPPLDDAAIAEHRAYLKDRRRTARVAADHLDFLREYRLRLDRLRVVDPACGSGAFLIQALNRLVEEYRWVVAEQERITGAGDLFDSDAIIRSILAHNIYGVDINPESVEITKLALWLHTAAPGKPLCALDHNIRCGNSLVGPDFYTRRPGELFIEEARERINGFDWEAAFPDVFSHGGFDCVVGNPPYIKLQHFRRAQAEVADYLAEAGGPDGAPLYESTRTGNFDMYLPFIEKGIRLLRPEGRMGYIAPNVWMVNAYGQALRRLLRRTRRLDRWLDFKSFQVFDEAITYTALQFFRGQPAEAIACAFAPDGNVSVVDWEGQPNLVPYDELPEDESWILVPLEEKRLIESLGERCPQLGDRAGAISQGLISGAFWVYANEQVAPGRYLHVPKKSVRDEPPAEVALEDSVTLKLVSGDQVRRYQDPATNLRTIFPYTSQGNAELLDPQAMARNFPKAWAFLKSYEEFLRKRDGGKLNDDQWYRYSRNQNLDKQAQPKLLVAGTAQSLLCTVDEKGEYAANDKRVYTILAETIDDLWYLAGVLNGPVATFVLRRIARPKAGGYYDIETQYLAPLPIPEATPEQRAEVGRRAKELQELHTRRRDLVAKLDQRLNSPQTAPLQPAPGPDWLWAEVGSPATWKASPEAPEGIKGRELTAWAKARHAEALQERLDHLDALLQPGAELRVEATDDEIALRIQGREALRLYDRPDTPFLAVQWRHALRDLNVTESFDAARLLRLLLALRTTADAPLRARLLALDAEIQALDTEIEARETDLNHHVFALYGLSEEERRMVVEG